MRYAKKQESMAHTNLKKQSVKTVPEEAKLLDILDQEFKSAI